MLCFRIGAPGFQASRSILGTRRVVWVEVLVTVARPLFQPYSAPPSVSLLHQTLSVNIRFSSVIVGPISLCMAAQFATKLLSSLPLRNKPSDKVDLGALLPTLKAQNLLMHRRFPLDVADFRMDPVKVKEHFDRIGCFRVLIMGRSNAGKTTILQRVCNTMELPEVFNARGEKVISYKVIRLLVELLIGRNDQIDPMVVQGSVEVSQKHHPVTLTVLIILRGDATTSRTSWSFRATEASYFTIQEDFKLVPRVKWKR